MALVKCAVHFDSAGSHKVWFAVFVRGVFTCKFEHKVALVQC